MGYARNGAIVTYAGSSTVIEADRGAIVFLVVSDVSSAIEFQVGPYTLQLAYPSKFREFPRHNPWTKFPRE